MAHFEAFEILIDAIGKNDLGRLALGVHHDLGLASNGFCLHHILPLRNSGMQHILRKATAQARGHTRKGILIEPVLLL